MKTLKIFIGLILCFTAVEASIASVSSTESVAALPVLKGKMVYHNYTSYDARDSRLYLFDFASNQLIRLGDSWNITHPMNAHFSPDGKQITFMGINPPTDSWSIYLYELGSSQAPVRLSTGNSRDEDPKFSPDGKKIVFKRNERIGEMTLATGSINWLTPEGASYSMPYYSPDGAKLVCSKDGGQNSSICLIDIQTKAIKVLYDKPDLQDYYPVAADGNSFYYTAGFSASNRIDQIYRGYWNGQNGASLPFNRTDGDYSDAYPVNDRLVILSSTRPGSAGGYDLYVADVETGEIYSLANYSDEINTSREDLGAAYHNPETPVTPSNSLTYTVQVPSKTKVVYIVGNPTDGWGNFVEMQRVPGENKFTITIENATKNMEYEYCAGPGWEYEEIDARGRPQPHPQWTALDIAVDFMAYYEPAGTDSKPYPEPIPELIITCRNNMITVTGEFKEVSIYDISGQRIQYEKVTNRFTSKRVNPGLYFIKTDKQSGKIVVR
ncbi:MAG: T9SS type A sorting domain-containing protein [Tannerella sp.]|jgi:hypothetical protein|nr:T9SS type A sorting domain-containing protein [Tannerella sp.]